MEQVIIGVDPHKLSATIEVVDQHEKFLGSGRFTTDQAGYAAMRRYAKSWPTRVWAVEGANGTRHALALVMHRAGVAPVDAAAVLGHSVEVHLSVYLPRSDEGARSAADTLGRMLAAEV
jgi:hypothetical protein